MGAITPIILKKIEELTLYLIEEKKISDALQGKISSLEKQLAQLDQLQKP
jgi:hypothetical protein